MEQIILQILEALRRGETVDDRALVKLVNAQARRTGGDKSRLAKRRLLPFYQQVKRDDPARWRSWGVTPDLEGRLLAALRMKPRRSASGVSTITVITKPWPCGSDCLYCPNDIRMPKSYLHGEPACERAEQNCFDPYLQVSARLTALSQMGHATDKIELIVLGGTWSDYPRDYQVWFIHELFRALNDSAIQDVAANPLLVGAAAEAPRQPGDPAVPQAAERPDRAKADPGTLAPVARCALPAVAERWGQYRQAGIAMGEERIRAFATAAQRRIDAGACTYNQAFHELYGASDPWARASSFQRATLEQLERQQHLNETARHRVVGLVIETRPDAVTPESLTLIRRLGCTKVQMGVQSLDQEILDINDRGIRVERIARAFELLRAFGFKIHAHAMANLLGATPKLDKADYRELVRGRAFQPDEVKLYPCALIGSSRLCRRFDDGSWRPYTEEELLDVLVADVACTPAFCRISRMIRDFSSNDILVGNKKPNLRQMVEERLRASAHPDAVQEIRFREVATDAIDPATLELSVACYRTSNTRERFLQWVTPAGRIAGFLRLSLPDNAYVRAHARALPVAPGEAMIREVHVYGMATGLGQEARAAQHLGLGRKLVEHACRLAREEGYGRLNVISAVGTRAYYRRLGFIDHGLYQQKELS